MKTSDAVPCPECGGSSIVTNSRPGPMGINRRRECMSCETRFSTVEVLREVVLDVKELELLASKPWAQH